MGPTTKTVQAATMIVSYSNIYSVRSVGLHFLQVDFLITHHPISSKPDQKGSEDILEEITGTDS